jgi:hypothetical protein
LASEVVATVSLGEGAEERLAAVLSPAPSIVLDYLWGPVAEVAFAALQRRGLADDTADITYTQIGGVAGPTAALPASLLRSRRIRVVGSGAGSASTQQIVAQIPSFLELIADGSVRVPYREFRLEDAAAAWAYQGPGRAVLVP